MLEYLFLYGMIVSLEFVIARFIKAGIILALLTPIALLFFVAWAIDYAPHYLLLFLILWIIRRKEKKHYK